MARPIPVIYAQLLTAKQAQTNLNSLNSTSQVSIWNLWLWIVAAGQSIFEQLCDLFQTNLETITSNAPVFSAPWYQNMLLYFQYSASNPQVVLQNPITFAVSYAVVNTSLNIITQGAVQIATNREVNVKVASNSAPLSSLQQSALKSYLSAIGIPGTQFNIVSQTADIITCYTTVYFDASYSGVIQANLQAAYNAFLAAIPFNGSFEVSDLVEALKVVQGVKDVVINTLTALPYLGVNPNYLVQTPVGGNPTLILRNWQTIAGYATDNSAQIFTQGLTLIAQ